MAVAPIRSYKKGERVQVSAHFSSHEFDCHCTHNECVTTYISDTLLDYLEQMRVIVGARIYIDSGYRCVRYQLDLKNAGSRHIPSAWPPICGHLLRTVSTWQRSPNSAGLSLSELRSPGSISIRVRKGRPGTTRIKRTRWISGIRRTVSSVGRAPRG